MNLALAFLCAATAFPAMLFERFKPLAPDPMKIAPDPGRSFYHNYKNLWTETLRADCQWHGKFLAFAVVTLAVLAVLT
jgi:hypothetical protein